ncbi:MAG: hypothetical protein J0M12_00580 [Deltaproteobacteria bacterium]|nr:hypothetical protein [Deltaproteobacteria bacterium]
MNLGPQGEAAHHRPSFRPAHQAVPSPSPAPASDETLKVLQAVWDRCNMARDRLEQSDRRTEAHDLSREILRTLGVWRGPGLDAALTAGADLIRLQVPKNVSNILSRALEVQALLQERAQNPERAYAIAKLACNISAAPHEVVSTFARLSRNRLSRLSDLESELCRNETQEILFRHLSESFEIQGTSVSSKLVKGKPAFRDRALWALREAAEYSIARGLIAENKDTGEREKLAAFERAADCGICALQVFKIANDISSAHHRTISGAEFNREEFGLSERNVHQLIETLLFCGDGFQRLGKSQEAKVIFETVLWISERNTSAREALLTLQDIKVTIEASSYVPVPQISFPEERRPQPPKTAPQVNWTGELSAEMEWDTIRAAPGKMLGWDLSWEAQQSLTDMRIRLGAELARELVPEGVLQDVSHDLAVLSAIPQEFIPAFLRFAGKRVKSFSTSRADFISALGLETAAAFIRDVPAMDHGLRRKAILLIRDCETATRKMHKPLQMGNLHEPVLKVFRVLLQHRLVERATTKS